MFRAMNPDDERDLDQAFAELHRRQCEEAPPFGAMRERALRRAGKPQAAHRFARGGWAAVAACLVVAAVAWWPGAPSPRRGSVPLRVEQLLNSIEQHLERNSASAFANYPTDILLTQTSQPSYP